MPEQISARSHKGAIIFYLEGWPSVCGGGQNILGWSEGGQIFFKGPKGGPKFFERPKGVPIFFSRGGPIFLGPKGGSIFK